MSKSYIGQIVDAVNSVTERCGPVLLFGENIDTGSRLSGLARGLTVNSEGRILNVGNCELTHMGIGFGMMLDGGRSTLFMKQLDFLLLGLDQIVNTFNFVRATKAEEDIGSFTIFLIVCDQGYQGPQSSLNSAGDIASLANVDVYCLNGASDAESIIRDQFVESGFRIICTSQRLFGSPALDVPVEEKSIDNAIFKYRSGNDVTIACYNFSLRHGLELAQYLSGCGIESDLFHINFLPQMNNELIVKSCLRTGGLVLLDDSKTVTKFGDALVTKLNALDSSPSVLSIGRRGCIDRDYGAVADQLDIEHESVHQFVLGLKNRTVTA